MIVVGKLKIRKEGRQGRQGGTHRHLLSRI